MLLYAAILYTLTIIIIIVIVKLIKDAKKSLWVIYLFTLLRHEILIIFENTLWFFLKKSHSAKINQLHSPCSKDMVDDILLNNLLSYINSSPSSLTFLNHDQLC